MRRMKALELLDNPEFDFNVDFQVGFCNPTEDDPDHIDIIPEKDYPKFLRRNISVINMENGVLTIVVY